MLYSVLFRFGHIRRSDQCAVYILYSKISTDPGLPKIRHSHRFVAVVIQFLIPLTSHIPECLASNYIINSPSSRDLIIHNGRRCGTSLASANISSIEAALSVLRRSRLCFRAHSTELTFSKDEMFVRTRQFPWISLGAANGCFSQMQASAR